MMRFNKPSIGRKDLESVLYCMITDDLAPGDHVALFSSQLAKILALNTVGVFNSYFHAFELIFCLLNAQPGDEVIVPSYTRSSLLHAVLKQALRPVLVDIEEDSFLPSFEQIGKKLNKNTRCIIIPQMYGIPYDISKYYEFELPIIEDLDGAIGSRVDGKSIGSFGDYVTMSFNDSSLITTGNGGMLASKDKRLKEMIGTLKKNGYALDYFMSDFNASLGISQLNRLEKSIEKRRKIAEYYDGAVMVSKCSLIGREVGKELCFSDYVVKIRTPLNETVRFFKQNGVPVKRGIDRPLHSYLGCNARDYREAEEMYHTLLALPIYPTLTKEDIENVSKGIKTIF